MNSEQKLFRKIRILYADDQADNVRSLIEGIKAAGLLPEHLAEKIVLYQLDLDQNIMRNQEILHHQESLIEIDYATLMQEAINRVRDAKDPYDLIISDWYFGVGDPEFKDSDIGGIWIMLWGQNRNEKYKPVCKLYTAQTTQRQQRVDFTEAKKYIKSAFGIEIEIIRKSETAHSWIQHLEEYLLEVVQNITPYINKNDLVAVINHLLENLAFHRFNNSIEDNTFESFRCELLKLNDFELGLTDGKIIKLANLFPLLLGRYLRENGKSVIASMSHEEIAALLYARRLTFFDRDARNEKIEKLKQAGVECIEFREYDGSGNPIFGIQVESADYYEGPLTTINNLFTQSLDFTFKVQSFYLNEGGFSKWFHLKNTQADREVFDTIRKTTVLPEFEKLKSYFEKTPVGLQNGLPSFSEQIVDVIKKIEVDDIRDVKESSERSSDKRFPSLQRQPLYDQNSRKFRVSLKSLFRINVYDFLNNVLQLSPLADYEGTPEEYEPLASRNLYWYCNAWLVREGLRTIVQNMRGKTKFFLVLKPRNMAATPFVRYKIILRETGKGLSSVATAFITEREHLSTAASFLRGFCELTVRSKIGKEVIEYDVFSGTTDAPSSKMRKSGTDFEINFIQRRDP